LVHLAAYKLLLAQPLTKLGLFVCKLVLQHLAWAAVSTFNLAQGNPAAALTSAPAAAAAAALVPCASALVMQLQAHLALCCLHQDAAKVVPAMSVSPQAPAAAAALVLSSCKPAAAMLAVQAAASWCSPQPLQ
jgi:hypothetical protein